MINLFATLDNDTRIIDLSVGQLRALISSELAKASRDIAQLAKDRDQYIAGVKNLAKALGISEGTIHAYKRAGKLEGTYNQDGRVLLFNLTKVQQRLAKA